MDAKLQAKCDLLAENFKTVRHSARLDSEYAASLGALICTGEDARASEADIRRNRELLRDKVGAFNNLRGNVNVALLCKMSLAKDPEAYLDKVVGAYGALKQGRVFHSEYEALAASVMADHADSIRFDDVARRTQEVLALMNARHPLLTDSADTTVAALLAMSGLDIEATLADAEKCYETLKDDHFTLAKDALQSVCMVLALGGGMPVEERCARFREIRQALKDRKERMDAEQLPILAALVDADETPDQVAAELEEAEKYLRGKSGLGGIFGLGRQMRMVLAAAVMLQVKDEARGRVGVAQASGNALAAVITQQIIEMIILVSIMTVTATSHMSHSSSN